MLELAPVPLPYSYFVKADLDSSDIMFFFLCVTL
jgi:hypothetical protein